MTLSKETAERELYHDHCKPKLAELLSCIKLDKQYVRAQGCSVYTADGKEITDFIGGFGAALVGHNNPALKETLVSALKADIPDQVQVSLLSGAARLAQKLNELTPGKTGYFACFTNSGTESVEAALKHAYKAQFDKVRREYERLCRTLNDFYYQVAEKHPGLELPGGKKLIDFRDDIDEYNLAQFEAFQNHPAVIAFKGAYHGLSTSALKITFNKTYRESFQGLSALNTVFIGLTEAERLPGLLEDNKCVFYYPVILDGKVELRPCQITKVIALVFEPVLGEGGMIPLPEKTLLYLAENHSRLGLPYIVDEIQSGCGRTGTFYNYEQTPLKNIEPEYVLVSKALGGGLVKIGAALIRKDIYEHDFGILHASTFGEDDLSSVVALKFVELLEADDKALLRQVTRRGDYLKARLEELKLEFPAIIKEVRGKGLMQCLEFTDLRERSPFFRLSGKQGILSLLIASYLLEHHDIRLLPPLTTVLKGNPGKNRKSVLRIQPPALIAEAQIDKLIAGLREVLKIVDSNNEYCLIGHLTGETVPAELRSAPRRYANEWPIDGETGHIDSRIGFLIHPTTLDNLVSYFFPSLRDHGADMGRLRGWWNRMCRFLEPVYVKSDRITSNDYVIESNLVMVPFLPEYITGEKPAYLMREIRDTIQDAIIVAKELGDENIPLTMVGLGAFTSIATNNGLTVNDYEMCITTGNAYTVGLTVQGIYKAAAARGVRLAESTVSVVGASGNIGQTVARILAPYVGKLILVGSSRKDSRLRLQQVRKSCLEETARQAQLAGGPATVSEDLGNIGLEAARIINAAEAGGNTAAREILALGKEFIDIATDFGPLKESGIIIVATSSGDVNLIRPEMVKSGAIVCCTSAPSNLHADFAGHKTIFSFDGGLARLPENSAIRFVGMPVDGMSYGCLAETLLLGFDGYNHSFAKGALAPAQVYRTLELAAQHGFSLGSLYLNGEVVLN